MADALTSANGRFRLQLQDDGNLVAYDRGAPYWATNTIPAAPVPGPVPPAGPVTETWPRRGLSYYTSLTDPRLDLPGFTARLRDAGADYTRVWLLDAWAVGQHGTGQYFGFVPWEEAADGGFDLWAVNPTYLEHLRLYVETMNAVGVLPQLSGLELYSWSTRKAGMLWVPDASVGPFRHNRQGISYADDTAFDRIAQPSGEDAFLGAFYRRVVETLAGTVYTVELANEMPEKPLHARLRQAWRAAGYRGCAQRQPPGGHPGAVHQHADRPARRLRPHRLSRAPRHRLSR